MIVYQTQIKVKIRRIITKRKYENWPSWDLVYEWENVFSQLLDVPLINEEPLPTDKIHRAFRKIKDFFFKYYFAFVMNSSNWNYNNSAIIPCIIDFFDDRKGFSDFGNKFGKCPLVLVSSPEAYDFILQANYSNRIGLLPLSISDKYRISANTKFKKEYDLVLIGRNNPVLIGFLDEYVSKHKDFKYVYREQVNDEFFYFTSEGICLGNINTRERYIELMRKSRIGMYATPGIDGGEERTHGFNPVTPRFLEFIACGCHVIARYPDNADTQYYDLKSFCPSINNYEEFEKRMNIALSTEVDMSKYAAYLSKHYTSVRVNMLKELLKVL